MAVSFTPNQVFEWTWEGHMGDQAVINRWFFNFVGFASPPGAGSSDQACINAWGDAAAGEIETRFGTYLSSQYKCDRFRFRTIAPVPASPPGPPVFDYLNEYIYLVSPYVWAGLQTTDSLPYFNAITLRLQCITQGRNFRGSKRIAGVLEESTEGNYLTEGAYQDWIDQATGWPAAFTAVLSTNAAEYNAVCDLVVASQTRWTAGIDPYTSVIVNCQPNKYIGSQTSRKQKGGYR